jgi:hypothetical protein
VKGREWGNKWTTEEDLREGSGFYFAGVSSVYGGLRRKRLVVLGGFSGAASCIECREQAVGVGGWLCRTEVGRVQSGRV